MHIVRSAISQYSLRKCLLGVIHMGLANKFDWKRYWSRNTYETDEFMKELNRQTGSDKQNNKSMGLKC